MVIVETLRPEHMPEMVFTLCKLAYGGNYSKDKIRELITLKDSSRESTDQFNKVYSFAKSCGFIEQDASEIVSSKIPGNSLNEFKGFRYHIFSNIFKESSNQFTKAASWFISQDESVLELKTSADFLRAFPQDLMIPSEEFVLGFRFWMDALGLAAFNDMRNGNLVFATHRIIEDWLTIDSPFEANKPFSAKTFFDKLTSACPVFRPCISENNISTSLSMGLRVLHINGLIELKFIADSSDIWHLTKSINYSATNDISEVVVRC